MMLLIQIFNIFSLYLSMDISLRTHIDIRQALKFTFTY